MAFELEALVGHLYIVGGRTIKTTPPGALVEVAPRRAARGREADTFFVLVLPSGTMAPNTFYEQMAQMSAERYFSAGSSVTAALRETLNTLNNNLFEHNQSGRTHYEANLVCAVLRSDELYVARVGAAAAVIRYSGTTQTYPEDLTVDETLYQPPLGVQPIPIVHMKRYPVDAGTRFLLADASIAEVKLDNISHALTGSHLEQVLDDLKLGVLGQIQLVAIELVPPEVALPVPVVAGESTTSITAELAATRAQVATHTAEMAAVQARPRARPSLGDTTRHAAGSAAQSTGRTFLALGEVAGKLFARPIEESRPRVSMRFMMLAVIGLPALIALIVVVSWTLNVGGTILDTCVSKAVASSEFARSLDSSNPASVVAAWDGTLIQVNECLELRADDPTMLALQVEGRDVLDKVNDIRRRDATLLATFPDARITSLVLQGLDLYALDTANNLVYRVQIGEDGVSAATLPQPITSMRQGASVDGMTVGELIDIGFDDQENAIVALDRNGVLVRCLPRFIVECDGQRLLASETWQNPTRITVWQGRLYLLDPLGNQLWRYQATGGTYTGSPSEYFAGQVRPNLLTAVDFDITTTGVGTVYVLFSDGLMTSHVSGEAQPFAFSGFPDGHSLSEVGVQSMYLNDSPINTAIYFVSQQARTVYETSLAGTFGARYRVFSEDDFALLSDVVVEPSQRIIYAASGNAVFAVKMQ